MSGEVPTMPRVSKCDRSDDCPELIDHDSRCPKFDGEFWSKVIVQKPSGLDQIPFATDPMTEPDADVAVARVLLRAVLDDTEAEFLEQEGANPWRNTMVQAKAVTALVAEAVNAERERIAEAIEADRDLVNQDARQGMLTLTDAYYVKFGLVRAAAIARTGAQQ